MKDPHTIIRKPVITEKSTFQVEENKEEDEFTEQSK